MEGLVCKTTNSPPEVILSWWISLISKKPEASKLIIDFNKLGAALQMKPEIFSSISREGEICSYIHHVWILDNLAEKPSTKCITSPSCINNLHFETTYSSFETLQSEKITKISTAIQEDEEKFVLGPNSGG